MAVFIYDNTVFNTLAGDRLELRKSCARELVTCDTKGLSLPRCTKVMLNHKLVVYPSAPANRTVAVRTLMHIAFLLNKEVISFDQYMLRRHEKLRRANKKVTKPAAACAVPPSQHRVAVGQILEPA